MANAPMNLFVFTWGHGCGLVIAKSEERAAELLKEKQDVEWEHICTYDLADDYDTEGDVMVFL